MENWPESRDQHHQSMSRFLDALRTAAQTGAQLVIPADQVCILLSDEVYTEFSRMEAHALRTAGLSENYPAPSALRQTRRLQRQVGTAEIGTSQLSTLEIDSRKETDRRPTVLREARFV